MKLKHFLALVSLVGVAGIVLLVKACKSNEPPPKPQGGVVTRPEPRPVPPSDPPLAPISPAPTGMDARPYDAEVLAWKDKSISGDKVKDASKGKAYKINLYKDPGKTKVNRAKVDLDRDDKFDEKYTFEDGKITLEIAPYDDENYTKTYHWTGTEWRVPGAAAPQPSQTDTTTPGDNAAKADLPARAYDAEVLAWQGKSISGDKIKDASKGKPYKVNVYMDAGHSTVNRAKVDTNRNDKFEDKYTFEPGKITLQRAPADDEQYTETYHWVGGGWAKQP